MWVIILGVIGGAAVLVLAGLRSQATVLRDWQTVLKPWGEGVYEELERHVEGELRMADYAYSKAVDARAAGFSREAIRLLGIGSSSVQRMSPDMVTLLRGMSVVSRMAAAITVVEPLRARHFRLPRLTSLVALAGFAHHLLVSTAERYRLRAFVLRRGFGMTTRFLLERTERICSRCQATETDWDRIEAARADLRTLSRESLQTFQVLLRSLAAEPR
jgi:hypothetical protein